MNTSVKISVEGRVEVFTRKDGMDTVVENTHNALQQTGLTVIANALSAGIGITHVYFIYSSSSSPTPIGASSGTLTAASLLALASSSVGIVKAPVFSMGTEASDTIVDTAVLASITDPVNHEAGLAFNDGVNVYAVGLVQQTPSGDVLYAAADITKIAKAANAQVGVRWKTTITTD